MNVLIVNAFLYVVTAFYFWRKYKITPFVFLWIYYSIFAILGILVVSSGVYFEAFSVSRNKELSLEPYIYNYICMLLFTYPLSKVTLEKFDIINLPWNFNKHKNIVLTFFLTLIVCRFIELNLYSGMGFHERHLLITQEGKGLNLYSISWILGWIASLSNRIVQILYPLCMFVLFFCFLEKKISILKLILVASILLSPYLIAYYISANRSGMFFLFVNLSFFYFLYKPYLSAKSKSKIFLVASILLCLLLSFSFGISSERFVNSNVGVSGSIFRYFGEVFPNLGYQFWDEVKIHTLGARKFSSYFNMFFDSDIVVLQGFDATFDHWSFITGVDTTLFKTVFGDLYIEFDTVGAFIFISVLSFIAYRLVNKFPVNIYNMPFYYYYYAICSNLILDFAQIYTSFSFLYTIIGIIIVSYLLRKKIYFG